MMRTRRGFTLIELLVVIAIIAILAAILFPVFANAKRNAWTVTCASNMKQWAQAMQQYVDNYNGRFPYAGATGKWTWGNPRTTENCAHNPAPPPIGQGSNSICPDVLEKYTHNKGIRWCPMFKSIYKSQMSTIGWSYWYFCKHNNRFNSGFPGSVLCGYSWADVTAATRKPCVAEIWGTHGGVVKTSTDHYTINLAYCDGHVKTINAMDDIRIQQSYVNRDGTLPF